MPLPKWIEKWLEKKPSNECELCLHQNPEHHDSCPVIRLQNKREYERGMNDAQNGVNPEMASKAYILGYQVEIEKMYKRGRRR